MRTVITAVIAGLIAFLAKLWHDLRLEHQARKALAAALSGELGAYLRLLQPERTMENIKLLTAAPYDKRIAALRGAFNLPSGHPVFDRVADKIGTLSTEAARGVSEAYNIVTGGRLALMALSSDVFLQSSDEIQVIRIRVVADMFIEQIDGVRQTIAMLDRLSRQTLFCYLTGGE